MGSTIALAEAAGLEQSYLPAGWEIKLISGGDTPDGPAPAAQLIDANETTGEVTAIVGVTGIVDHVNDLIEPGAYKNTLTKRRPKVCWAHSWEMPIGKVLRIEEWLPGDPRFAKVGATLDGKAWPAEAGALVAHMQMNLKSDKGKEAFAAVEFYSKSGECEWSIGWQPIPAKTMKRKDGVRVCKAVELFEVSPVLFGAAPLTRTLEVKALNLHSATRRGVAPRIGQPAGTPAGYDDPAAPVGDAGGDDMTMDAAAPTPGEGDPLDEATLHRNALPEIDWAEVDAAANPATAPGPGTGAVAAGTPLAPDDEDAVDAGIDDAEEEDPEDAADGGADEDTEDESDDSDPEDPEDPEDAADGGDDEDTEDAAGGKKKPQLAPPFAKKSRGGFVLDAKALTGFTDVLDLAALGVVLPEVKASGGADKNRGNAEQLRRWYVHGDGAAHVSWGTPGDFDRCVAIAGKHMDPERARGYCNLRHHDALGMYPATHAAADRAASGGVAAAAQLAKSWNPLLEVGVYAAHGDTERKFLSDSIDGLAGSFEQRQSKLRTELEPILKRAVGLTPPTGSSAGGGDSMMAARPSAWDDAWVSIDGTWPDRVIATIAYREDDEDGERDKQTFQVPYTWTGDTVSISEPQPVELQVSIVPSELDDDDEDEDPTDPDGDGDDDSTPGGDTDGDTMSAALLMPALRMLTGGSDALKTALIRSPEVKAGRVLSEANASRLRGALEHLLEVARSAGIDLPGWTGPDQQQEIRDDVMPDTTAPVGGAAASVASTSFPTAKKSARGQLVLSATDLQTSLGNFLS